MRKELERLNEGFVEQYKLYREMLSLSEKQEQMIDNVDALYKILLEKQKIVLKIQEIDSQIANDKKWWTKNKANLPESERRETEIWFEKIEEVLKRLLEMENQLSDSVKKEMRKMEQDLAEISVGKRAVKAYGSVMQKRKKYEPRFVDKQR